MDAGRPTKGLLPEGLDHALVQRYRLRVLAGTDAGAVFDARGERVTIGTHPSTDFVLHDPTMSRFHCEIRLTDGTPLLRDLGSRNGTRVGGVLVHLAPLKREATLALGRTQIRFDLGKKHLKVPLSRGERFGCMVGRSRAMRALFALLEQAAQVDSTVLLQGETGTGKEAAAESLHRESARAAAPFIVIDCGAIPGPMLEDELFGHEAGAFTGAVQARAGAFEAADGGSLFLDEIGELGVDLQPKLLRALESRCVQRIGTTQRRPVNVRVIAATNRDLKAEVNTGRFRADLYYRLAVIEARLPPLRECLEDLPLLVESLLEGLGQENAEGAAGIRSAESLAALAHHAWPGNVRELRNVMERRLALTEMEPLTQTTADELPRIDPQMPLRVARERWLHCFERRYLRALLEQHGYNVSAAARAAGIDRIHFYRLMARCGLRAQL